MQIREIFRKKCVRFSGDGLSFHLDDGGDWADEDFDDLGINPRNLSLPHQPTMFPTLPIPKMSFQASPCQTQADRPPLDGLPIARVPRYTLLSRKRSGTYQSLDCREQLFKIEEQDDWELPWFVDEYARCAG